MDTASVGFRTTATHEGWSWSLTCTGDLDLDTAERFRTSVDDVVRRRPERLRLDCSGISFIDSVGIRAIVVTARLCADRSIELELVLNSQTGRLFRTLGITESILGAEIEEITVLP